MNRCPIAQLWVRFPGTNPHSGTTVPFSRMINPGGRRPSQGRDTWRKFPWRPPLSPHPGRGFSPWTRFPSGKEPLGTKEYPPPRPIHERAGRRWNIAAACDLPPIPIRDRYAPIIPLTAVGSRDTLPHSEGITRAVREPARASWGWVSPRVLRGRRPAPSVTQRRKFRSSRASSCRPGSQGGVPGKEDLRDAT